MPGDCSPSRSVVSKINTRLGSRWKDVMSSSPLVARASLLLGRFAATCGRHALFPPRGEEKKSKGEPARHALSAYQALLRHWGAARTRVAGGRGASRPPACRGDYQRLPRRCAGACSTGASSSPGGETSV